MWTSCAAHRSSLESSQDSYPATLYASSVGLGSGQRRVPISRRRLVTITVVPMAWPDEEPACFNLAKWLPVPLLLSPHWLRLSSVGGPEREGVCAVAGGVSQKLSMPPVSSVPSCTNSGAWPENRTRHTRWYDARLQTAGVPHTVLCGHHNVAVQTTFQSHGANGSCRGKAPSQWFLVAPKCTERRGWGRQAPAPAPAPARAPANLVKARGHGAGTPGK